MLWYAIRNRHVRVARVLVDARANVNFDAKPDFYDAALQREAHTAACTLRRTTDHNLYGLAMTYGAAVDPLEDQEPDGGLTSEYNTTSMLRLLLESGVDPNTVEDDGETTPLWHAVAQRHPGRVELLLRYGADPQSNTSWPPRILQRYSLQIWRVHPQLWLTHSFPEYCCVMRAALMRIPATRDSYDGITSGYKVARQLIAAGASRGTVDSSADAAHKAPQSDAERITMALIDLSAQSWQAEKRAAKQAPRISSLGPNDAAFARRRQRLARSPPFDLVAHRQFYAFLVRSRRFTTRLHYLDVLSACDVVNLVRGGANMYAPGRDDGPTPVQYAGELQEGKHGTSLMHLKSAQALLALAGWSVQRHPQLSPRVRARAVTLKRMSESLARQKVPDAHKAFTDVFDAFVLPMILRQEIEKRTPKEVMAVVEAQ